MGGGRRVCGAVAAWLMIGLSVAVAAPASREPPARFDLDCTLHHLVKRRMVTVRTHVRIDLEQRRWCEATCESVNELTLAADLATLASRPVAEGPTVTTRTVVINRRSGHMKDERITSLDQDVVMDDLSEGVCRVRPYTDIDRKLF